MVTRIEIAVRPDRADPRGQEVAASVRSFLGIPVDSVRTRDVYHIETALDPTEQQKILDELVDPALQQGALGRLGDDAFDVAVAVGYKPGVTDPVGKSALVAVRDTLGRELTGDAAVYTSRLYLLNGVDLDQAARIASELLANPVIQTIEVRSREELLARPPDLAVPRVAARPTPSVERVDLSGSDEDLLGISRTRLLALNLEELRAIRDRFRKDATGPRSRSGLGAQPTDAELECLAQTWSEHCKHKIFNATIRYREGDGPVETIPSLFLSYIKRVTHEIDRELGGREGGSWLVSVFHDNAGVVTFDDEVHLVYKVETHNSPSALDPYGGAITGIVGVNRDPFGTGMGADLLVNVWGYCFASPFHEGELPRGLLHPRRIRDGVHAGVIDGGNQSGVPYGRGWELFDDRYLGKPLVFCGTVGALPVRVPPGRPGEDKAAREGDRIVMVGGRIGADGIHGATFSSAVLDESSPVQAVQIGDPITQKRMFDFLLEARGLGLYEAITDNGAGGLSSSVGEMAEACGGARLDLGRAPLKYQGLAPWEILISEAQERMTLAVAPDKLDRLLELAARLEVEATDLGEFTGDGVLHVTHGETTVAWLPMEFLHEGDPDLDLEAVWSPPRFDEPPTRPATDQGELLLGMLGRLNVCSGEVKARHYDHEVKGLSVVKPWIGVLRDVPAEATVSIARHGSTRGFVLSEGINPFYSDIDTEAMARSVVDEALRRQVCGGARLDRIALLDNFCWPDPEQSATTPDGRYKLAQLVRACRGLYETARAYGTPLISGKDSMKNDSTRGGVKISVPPTLLVSAIGQIDDVNQAMTLEPQGAGEIVFLLGETADETGASEYFRYLGERDGCPHEPGTPRAYVGNKVPRLDTTKSLPLYRALSSAIADGLVRSAATPSRGGWAVSFARCAMAGRVGLDLELAGATELDDDLFLYSESNTRFLITIAPDDAGRFEKRFAGRPCRRVGRTTTEQRLRIRDGERTLIDLELAEMIAAFKRTLADV